MSFKFTYITFIFFTCISINNHIYAQHFIGITGGYSCGRFLDYTNDPHYDAKYYFNSGIVVSSFYETKIDSSTNFKIDLQYHFQRADLEVKSKSFYKNLDLAFHQLNLHLVPSFRLFDKKSLKINLSLGMVLSYNLHTHSKGNGWEHTHVTQIDTNGNSIQVPMTQYWEKDERNSNDMSRFNVGGIVGLDFKIPINQKLHFLIQNNYRLFFTRTAVPSQLRYTSLFFGDISIGLRYQLGKK